MMRDDPHLYAKVVLGQTWTDDAQRVAEALVKYKKVAWRACHSVSKTYTSASFVNWFFDTRVPSKTITTAPTEQQVKDLLWREVRAQRRNKEVLQPRAPMMQTTDEHYAVGFTARDYNAFQGRHAERMLIVFDEAVGIDPQFFEAAEGMLTADENYWLLAYNPTDVSSQAYIEEQSGAFHVVHSSALNHPNIERELRGEPPLIHAGVRLHWLQERIKKWCDPTSKIDPKHNDFEFPPGSGKYYRPGPLFESRVLGLWPSSRTNTVWSESVWNMCLERKPIPDAPLEIGVDVARLGDDYTAIHVRRGSCSLHHERHNGWRTNQTAGRIKQLCKMYAAPPSGKNGSGEDPKRVLCKIDDTGVGGGVTDQRDGYKFVGINSQETARADDDYPNIRSELWFDVAERAEDGKVDVSRLDSESKKLIGQQCKAPTWKMDGRGRRVVEPKEKTKDRLKGASPDDADGFNLAYYQYRRTITVATS